MLRPFSITLFVILALILPKIHNKCLNSLQLQGLCTSCITPETLSFGHCMPPHPGCTQRISPSLCAACSSPYTLVDYTCTTYPASSVEKQLQTYSQAPDHKYQLLNYHFKSKHNQVLKDKISLLSDLITVQTTYGNLYFLTYRNPFSNNTVYKAEALVDYNYKVTQYGFYAIGNNTGQDLWSVIRRHVAQYSNELNGFSLNKIQTLSWNDHRLYFISPSGNILAIDVQKTQNFSSSHRQYAVPTQLYYLINQQTTLNYVFSHFPQLQKNRNYTASYYTVNTPNQEFQYYDFVFDDSIVVAVKIEGLELSMSTYQEPDYYAGLASQMPTPGSYLPFMNMQHSAFQSARNSLLSSYGFLSPMTLQSVRYQMVSGTNYLLHFNDLPFSQDKYLALLYAPISGQIQIRQLLRNGIDITSTPLSVPFLLPGAYNYQLDSTFRALYSAFRQEATPKVKKLMSINRVQRVTGTSSEYIVTYTPLQSAIMRFNSTSSSQFSFHNYTVHGHSIPLASSVKSQSNSRNDLLQFLNSQLSTIFAQTIVIKQVFSSSNNNTQIDLLTPYGSFYARVSHNGIRNLQAITKTSNILCSQLDPSENSRNNILASINVFLKNTYSQLSGSIWTLSQGYLNSGGVPSYRLVYDSGSMRYVALIKYVNNAYSLYSFTQNNVGNCGAGQTRISGVCQKSCSMFVF